jgi:hypothetical protein
MGIHMRNFLIVSAMALVAVGCSRTSEREGKSEKPGAAHERAEDALQKAARLHDKASDAARASQDKAEEAREAKAKAERAKEKAHEATLEAERVSEQAKVTEAPGVSDIQPAKQKPIPPEN